MRSIIVRIVAILFVLHRAAPDEGEKICRTPTGEIGDCRNIRNCNFLKSMMISYGNSTADVLRESVCGEDGPDPMVCCSPIDDDSDNENVTRKTAEFSHENISESECGTSQYSHSDFKEETPAKLGSWPWATILGYHGERDPYSVVWLCGGSLISSRHVLTAAHCVHGHPNLFVARFAAYNLLNNDKNTRPVDVTINNQTVHPRFNYRTRVNNIAVLRLDHDVRFSDYIRPICLPVTDTVWNERLGKRLSPSMKDYKSIIARWEIISTDGSECELRALAVTILDEATCNKTFDHASHVTVDKTVLCPLWKSIVKPPLFGNTGGQLMTRDKGIYYLIGLGSFGYRKAKRGFPSVYTRVTAYLDFIESLLN